MIQAIETEYAGYKFRSRLEARWAVFFNAMGVKWYYEHEGYKLSSGWYLPDFWLPEMKIHFEVKPDGICEHARAFRDTVGAIVVSSGMPGEELTTYCFDLCDSSGGTAEWYDTEWGVNEQNELCLFIDTRRDRSFYLNEKWDNAERILNGKAKNPFAFVTHST